MAAISLLSSPPLGVKNFSPLRLNGRWLAVTITAAEAIVGALTVDINIAGVEASPQSTTFAPACIAPFTKASLMPSPDRRQSVPIATVRSSLSVVSPSHFTNDFAIISVTSGVRFTCSPSTPSSATPLISEPFCSFFQFMDYDIILKSKQTYIFFFKYQPI